MSRLSVTAGVVWEEPGAVGGGRRGGRRTTVAASRFLEARWRLFGFRERVTLTFEVALPLVTFAAATAASAAVGGPGKKIMLLVAA